MWVDGVRVGRHSRQREEHGMQGGIGINISGKETFLIWGSIEDWKGGSGNKGRSQRQKPLNKHQVVCVHSCSESAEKGRLTKAEGYFGCSRQEIKQKRRQHLGGDPGTGGEGGQVDR